jgi:hypothetical protein
MKRGAALIAISGLLLLTTTSSPAASNLNSSRSNLYRLTYPTDLVSGAQAKAILVDLDRLGPADEAKLKRWLAANFKRHGIAADRVKKIVILPKSKELREIAIILLTDPADESQAAAAALRVSRPDAVTK